MAKKPNYRFERAERNRAKQAKRDEKLQRRQERAALRRDDSAPEPPEQEDAPER